MQQNINKPNTFKDLLGVFKTLASFDSLIRLILIQDVPLRYPQAHFSFGEFPWLVQHHTVKKSLEIVFPVFVWHRVLKRHCCCDSGEVDRAVSYLSSSWYSFFFGVLVAWHVRSSWHRSVTYMASNSLEDELCKPIWRRLSNWSSPRRLCLTFFPASLKDYNSSVQVRFRPL